MKFAPFNIFDFLTILSTVYFCYLVFTMVPPEQLTDIGGAFQVIQLYFIQLQTVVFITASMLYSKLSTRN